MNDRTSLTRDSAAESYGYDLNEQTTAGPDGTYAYDAAGNRSGTGFAANNLNQYTAFSGYTFGYDTRGNTTAIAAPTPTPPPVITTQPAPKTVTAGQTATFSVVASGAAPLSYQWRKNAANIANAIAASYTTPATTLADNRALFSVLVSNPGGSTLSNNATLTVNPAPTPTPTPTPPPNKVLPVTFNPNSLAHGTHPISSYRVYLQTTTPGAVIYWTHNRTTPVPGNGTTFKINSNYGPVDIPGGATWTLEAIAVKTGMTNSDVTTSGTYDNTDPGTSPPAAPGRAGAPQSAQFTITGTASYSYDAQNRLRSATVNGVTETFLYDGLNRKFSQTISGVTTVNVWDGWNLIQEYNSGSSVANYSYVYGIAGILERLDNSGANPIFYFQDALGNTAYITDSNSNMVEYYRYDRFGNVTIYNSSNQQLSASSYDIRHLYTGQLWMPQIGLYDMRNRVYSPTLQRFLQSDPVGFDGDPTHLYRYCENSPLSYVDPTGTTPLIGTAIGFFSGAVGGAIAGYAQTGTWRGAVAGGAIGGVVGAAVGTFVDFAAPLVVPEIVTAALAGSSSSYFGQVAGNYSSHISSNVRPRQSDFTNVNPGMIVGAGLGAMVTPAMFPGLAHLSSSFRLLGGVMDGIYSGLSEYVGGEVYNDFLLRREVLGPVRYESIGEPHYDSAGELVYPEQRLTGTIAPNSGFTPYYGGYEGGPFGSLSGIADQGGILDVGGLAGGGGWITRALLGY